MSWHCNKDWTPYCVVVYSHVYEKIISQFTHTNTQCSCIGSIANTSQRLPEGFWRYLRTLCPSMFERWQLHGRPEVLFQWVWPILCRPGSNPLLRHPPSVPHLRRQWSDNRDVCADQCQLSDQWAVWRWWRALLSEWLREKVSNAGLFNFHQNARKHEETF